MGLFDFFKKSEKSDVEKYYEQRTTAYNPMENQSQNIKQQINQNYMQPMQNNITFNTNVSFYMVIEDVFSVTGKGTVITGKIQSGFVNVGDVLNLQHNAISYQVHVRGLEQFRKTLQSAGEGEYVGILLAGVAKSDIDSGDILTK